MFLNQAFMDKTIKLWRGLLIRLKSIIISMFQMRQSALLLAVEGTFSIDLKVISQVLMNLSNNQIIIELNLVWRILKIKPIKINWLILLN